MSYFKNYEYVSIQDKASIGKHVATIEKVEPTTIKGYEAIVIHVNYKGKKLQPDTITIFLPTPDATEEQINKYRAKLSAIVDCFNLPHNLNDYLLSYWENKSGIIEVGEKENGYLAITKYYKHSDTEIKQIENSTDLLF